MRSFYKRFLAVAIACCALFGFLVTPAICQKVQHRDFDIEQFDSGSNGKDAVSQSAAVELIVGETNALRYKHDRSKLRVNKKLARAAQDFAAYMARTDRYGHQADGREPAERVSANDYDFCLVAENIAQRYDSAGYETRALAQRFMEGWSNSPEHRDNILDPDVTEIGVGLAHSDRSGRYYAVQLFARPKSDAIELEIANHSKTEVEYELGDEKFSLPSRMTRMHSRCRSARLTIKLSEETPQTIDIASNRRYIIRSGTDGQLELAERRDANAKKRHGNR